MKIFALSLTCLLALGLAAERPAQALDEDDLQTEINNNCSTNGCVIDLCGDTYTFGMTGDVVIDGDVRKPVVLEGCGWDSSIIERDGDSGSTGKSMIVVQDGGSLTLRNLKISYKETCASSCGSNAGSLGLVQVKGTSRATASGSTGPGTWERSTCWPSSRATAWCSATTTSTSRSGARRAWATPTAPWRGSGWGAAAL